MNIDICPFHASVEQEPQPVPGGGKTSLTVVMRDPSDLGGGYKRWGSPPIPWGYVLGSTLEITDRRWLVRDPDAVFVPGAEGVSPATPFIAELTAHYAGAPDADPSEAQTAMRLRLGDAWRAVAAAGWNWYPSGHEFIRYAYQAWHELKYGRPDRKNVFFSRGPVYQLEPKFPVGAALALDAAGHADRSGQTLMLTRLLSPKPPEVQLLGVSVRLNPGEGFLDWDAPELIDFDLIDGPVDCIRLRVHAPGYALSWVDVTALPVHIDTLDDDELRLIVTRGVNLGEAVRSAERMPPAAFGLDTDDDDCVRDEDARDTMRHKAREVAAKAIYGPDWRAALTLHHLIDRRSVYGKIAAPARPITVNMTDDEGKPWILVACRPEHAPLRPEPVQQSLFDD